MLKHEELTGKEKFVQGLAGFLQKNRIFLLSLFLVLVVGFIGYGIWSNYQQSRIAEGTTQVESIYQNYKDWSAKTSGDDKNALGEKINQEAAALAKKYKNLYPALRALYIMAQMDFEEKKWEQAATHFMQIADSFSKSYLAPEALLRAGLAYENSEQIDDAIAVYEKIYDKYQKLAFDMPRALFALGRLYETEKKDYLAARKYYNTLVDSYNESNWTKLAKDRIIYFDVNGLGMES